MSEQDNTGVENQSVSPTEQNLVPKERLDELIAQRNQLAAQTQVLQDLLRKAVPAQTQQHIPEQEPEHLQRLREENPTLYQMFKQQEAEKKRIGATLFQVMDNQDRQAFVQEFGEEAKKYLPQVEAKLQELRQTGVHNYNRGQIFVHLKGMEAITRPAQKPTIQAQSAVSTPNVQQAQNDFPSSDPRSASTTTASSATPRTGTATLDELEDRLKDVLL